MIKCQDLSFMQSNNLLQFKIIAEENLYALKQMKCQSLTSVNKWMSSKLEIGNLESNGM